METSIRDEYVLQIPLGTKDKEFAEQLKEDYKDILNIHGRDNDNIVLVRIYPSMVK